MCYMRVNSKAYNTFDINSYTLNQQSLSLVSCQNIEPTDETFGHGTTVFCEF